MRVCVGVHVRVRRCSCEGVCVGVHVRVCMCRCAEGVRV